MKDALIKSRRGQGKFRQQALTKYGKCCITGLSKKDLLIASHIKPWIVCSNDERLDVANCLLLTPDYDKLFDRGYITFIDGQLRISPKLTSKHRGCLKIKDNFKLNGMTDETKEYMRYHNTYRFKKK